MSTIDEDFEKALAATRKKRFGSRTSVTSRRKLPVSLEAAKAKIESKTGRPVRGISDNKKLRKKHLPQAEIDRGIRFASDLRKGDVYRHFSTEQRYGVKGERVEVLTEPAKIKQRATHGSGGLNWFMNYDGLDLSTGERRGRHTVTTEKVIIESLEK